MRTDVLAATGGARQPAEHHSLGDKEIYLAPPKGPEEEPDPQGVTRV